MSNADKRTAFALFRYTLILPLMRSQRASVDVLTVCREE